MDIYLHIGSGKTGTSSIQSLLSRNRDRLAARGYLYPWAPGRLRHTRLSLYARNDASLERQPNWRRFSRTTPTEFRSQLEQDLRAELRDAGLERVIVSDEAMYGLDRGEVERLHQLLAGIADNVHVVVYLRRQDDHMISRYQQRVKVGEIRSLPEHAALPLTGTYDYATRMLGWSEWMRPTTFTVRRFERSSMTGGSLLQDFLGCVGITDSVEELEVPPPDVNRSLDADAVKFLRLWNMKKVECHGETPRRINNLKHVDQLAEISSGPVLTLPDGALDAFMAPWEAGNEQVARDFLGDADGVLFHDPRRTRNTTTDQSLSVEARERILEHLRILPRGRRQLREIHEREAAREAGQS